MRYFIFSIVTACIHTQAIGKTSFIIPEEEPLKKKIEIKEQIFTLPSIKISGETISPSLPWFEKNFLYFFETDEEFEQLLESIEDNTKDERKD